MAVSWTFWVRACGIALFLLGGQHLGASSSFAQDRAGQPSREQGSAGSQTTEEQDAGHVSVSGGALAGQDNGSLAMRPLVRAELAFNIAGPLAAGGFVQVALDSEAASVRPAFGGGVMLTLRPQLPLLGFVPHLEITGSRVQLPSRLEAIVDAWSAGIGAGIGVALTELVSLEARVHHAWLFGLPPSTSLSDSSWTLGGALTVDLP